MSDTPPTPRSVILGGLAGNVMEWYDFAVYGYFAPIIASQFFPADSHAASLVAAFGAFAAGFLMRPLGGALFGHIGDRIGRKQALTLSVMMMAVPSALIGLLPTHAAIGWWAGALMVVLRMVQGLSVGGEYTTSIVFLVEKAHRKRRGLMGSWSGFGAVAGALIGSGVGAVVDSVVSPDALAAWGWRVPFILGLGVGFSALWLRKDIEPVEPAQDDAGQSVSPVVTAMKEQWPAILRVVGVLMVYSVGYYLCFLYLTTFLIDRVGVPSWEAMDVNTAAMFVLMLLIPVAALLSDKVGRKPLLLFSAGGMLAFSYPLLWLMHHPHWLMILGGQLGFAVLVAAFAGANPATMAEAFPRSVRISAMSIGFNISFALFGGTVPMVAAWLIERTRDDFSIAWYMTAAGAITLVSLLGHPETARVPLAEIHGEDELSG